MDNTRLSILEEDIIADITERKSLLLQTKTFTLRYSLNDQDKTYFLNYSIPTIYAIWEGFIQTTFQTYVRELNRLDLRMDEFCDQLIVYNLETKVKQLKNYPNEFNKKVVLINKLRSTFSSDRFEIFPLVDTKSNVGFNVLNKILSDFNLPLVNDYIRPKYSIAIELDKFLLKIRNDVAHGNNAIVIKPADIERAIDLIELLMDEVFSRVVHGFLREETYKSSLQRS